MSADFVSHRQCHWLDERKWPALLWPGYWRCLQLVKGHVHATPRQVAWLEEVIVTSPTFMDCAVGLEAEYS